MKLSDSATTVLHNSGAIHMDRFSRDDPALHFPAHRCRHLTFELAHAPLVSDPPLELQQVQKMQLQERRPRVMENVS
jgi:hypothetical protein